MRYTLTDAKVRAIKGTGKLQKITDGEGLSLRVSPDGKTKAWSYAYRITGFRTHPDGTTTTGKDGKVERAVSFETYPEVSLAQARQMHAEARKLVALDQCPAQAKKDAAEQRRREARNGDGSFKAFAERWIAQNEERWVPKYRDRVKGLLKNDIYPVIGKTKLNDVIPADIREIVLNKKAFPTAAFKARQLIREVFDWAIANLHAKTNPAAELKIRKVIDIPKPDGHKPMSEFQLGEFFRALKALETSTATQPSSIAAARLIALTGVRKNEARLCEWTDIVDLDGDKPLWIVPAEKMKMKESHKSPLSTQVVALLKEQRIRTGGRQYVFTVSGKPLASCTFNAMWTRLNAQKKIEGQEDTQAGIKDGLTVHATRATIATILREHGFSRETVEKILAHTETGTAAAYHFPELIEGEGGRREALQYYSDLVDKLAAGANVIPLKRKAA